MLWSGADWSRFGAKQPFSTPYTLSLIGGVGGTVTLLSYGYWMREAGWSGPRANRRRRAPISRVSFALVFIFCISMIFLATQIDWTGQILDEGPRLCLLLADRIGAEIGPIGRGVFLLGFWGAAFSSVLGVWHGVPFLFDDWIHLWRRQTPTGQQGAAYRAWAGYLTLAAISALLVRASGLARLRLHRRRLAVLPVRDLDAALAEQLAACDWCRTRNGVFVNIVLGAALLLYVYLAYEYFAEVYSTAQSSVA